jgi:hypothetical protein
MPDIIDEHYYNNPEFFMNKADMYDKYDRSGPKIFVGEYAVTRDTGTGSLRGAIGEAAFMTGLERNSDIVTMAAYAPLFVHVNHRHWNPDLINFDNSRAYGLPSYYVQQLFAVHRGDVVLPTTVEAPPSAAPMLGGAIGVGTWMSQAEFKDLRVIRDGKTIYQSDFGNGTKDWRVEGRRWRAETNLHQGKRARRHWRLEVAERLHLFPQSPQTRRRGRVSRAVQHAR